MKFAKLAVVLCLFVGACTAAPAAPTTQPTPQAPSSTAPPPSTSSSQVAAVELPPIESNTWRMISPLPIGARTGHSAIWTGSELIVWGGSASNVGGEPTGAAYDPNTDTWQMIADAPLAGRSRHTAVWTGTEMIVWGGRNPGIYNDGAAYSPATNSWRLLSLAGLSPRSNHAAVWTGSEMIIYGGHTSLGNNAYAADGAAYNPTTDSWRQLASAGIPARSNPSAVWTGSKLVVWGGVNGDQLWQTDGAAYDPGADRWRTISQSPLDGREAALGVWTGTELVIVGGVSNSERYRVGAAAYDPTSDTWRDLGGPDSTSWARGAWTGDRLLYLDALQLWDGSQWVTLPPMSAASTLGGTATWTGRDLIVIGGEVAQDTPGDTAVAFRLGPPGPGALVPVTTTTLPPLTGDVNERLQATVAALSSFGPRIAGTEAEQAASSWLNDAFAAATGLVPFTEDILLPNDHGTRNVWVTLGDGPVHVLLGGHYDSVTGSLGVDDNISGVAVLLELMGRLARQPIDGLTVTVVAFGAEELLPGFSGDNHHFGSRHMAARLATEGQLPDYMVSVDMIGVGNRLMAVTYEQTDATTASLLADAGTRSGVAIERLSRGDISDHEAFARAGVPSAFLWRPDNPAWHTSGDDSVDVELLLEDLSVLESFLEMIAP